MLTLLRANSNDCIKILQMQIVEFKPLLDKYQDYDISSATETLEIVKKI